MGSQIVLNMGQQHPFRIGLNKLRKILNDPAEMEVLASKGLQRINLVADHLNSGQFKTLFGSPAFLRWVNGIEGWDHNRSFYWYVPFKNDGQRERCRSALIVLRDTLNDKRKYEELVQIGPCALTLCWEEDDPRVLEEDSPILISNFIPECWPNADYSVRANGETYFHS